ncbi:ATP-binding protein [Herbivorax sp. ANBcel31]|uniref:ATP-binding protein n=1 Tax=Herbivorax sp. ANBcel31 TaxID=3069754 RepID=UPI0027AFDEDE|nr:ATP-binding protein [Herbivorax sp. ANBcel31]MDQ2085923.1 ATP-binding protein [Herbivorax sp. ANBcel31]
MINATQSNWHVITGSPRSGKTKIIERLSFLGYKTCPEILRIYIDNELSKGRSMQSITSNGQELEKNIFYEKLSAEKNFNRRDTIFFDRSIIDSIAFARLYKRDMPDLLRNSKLKFRYSKIFLLEPLNFYDKDYLTMESEEESKELNEHLIKAYSELEYDIIRVPIMPIEKRVNFILNNVNNVI